MQEPERPVRPTDGINPSELPRWLLVVMLVCLLLVLVIVLTMGAYIVQFFRTVQP